MEALARMAARSVQDGDCLVYQGYRNKAGYGVIWHEGRRWLAHRLAMTLRHGDVPTDAVVMHSCDNPPCWRDEHLSIGTYADNNIDKITKGRHWRANTTHCINGHEFTPENTYWTAQGTRLCRECGRAHRRRYRERRAAGVSG